MFSSNNNLVKLEHTSAINFERNRLSITNRNPDLALHSVRTESALINKQLRLPIEKKIKQRSPFKNDLEVQD